MSVQNDFLALFLSVTVKESFGKVLELANSNWHGITRNHDENIHVAAWVISLLQSTLCRTDWLWHLKISSWAKYFANILVRLALFCILTAVSLSSLPDDLMRPRLARNEKWEFISLSTLLEISLRNHAPDFNWPAVTSSLWSWFTFCQVFCTLSIDKESLDSLGSFIVAMYTFLDAYDFCLWWRGVFDFLPDMSSLRQLPRRY